MAMVVVTIGSSSLTQNKTPLKPSFVTRPPIDDGCAYCHSSKYVVKQFFKKNDYPDQWEAFQDKKTRAAREAQEGCARRDGKAAMATGYVAPPPPATDMSGTLPMSSSTFISPQSTSSSSLSITLVVDPALTQNPGNTSFALLATNSQLDPERIIDLGATNHMTYEPSLLRSQTIPHHSSMANVNGVAYPVSSTDTIEWTPFLSLEHTLLVYALSNNLLYVPQVTKLLNCLVLIYMFFCLLQDISSQEIIGHGTKREALLCG